MEDVGWTISRTPSPSWSPPARRPIPWKTPTPAPSGCWRSWIRPTPRRPRALGRLADVLLTAPLDFAGVVALACGALVEQGGDPERPLDALLGRLPEVLTGAVAFADACRVHAKEAPAADDAGDAVDASATRSRKRCLPRPSPGRAGPVCQCRHRRAGTIPRRPAACTGRPDLLRQAQAVTDLHGKAKFLTDMLRVLDEEILVLHPETGRGWKVRVRGVSDNFQLHTLLADALIGDPEKGFLPGRRPDPRVVAAARDRPVDPAATLAEGAFNLMNWQALRPDRTLPAGQDGSAHWIWNEGVPADIEGFEGARVVLLGPPPYHRTWNAGRCFVAMPAELRVVETLTAAAVNGLLGRIATAPRTAKC